MATRSQLQAQLDSVEAEILKTQKAIDEETDFDIREAHEASLSMLRARALSLRQQIAATQELAVVANPAKTAKKERKELA